MRSKRRVLTLLGIVLVMSAGMARADVIINFTELGPTGTNLANSVQIPLNFGSAPNTPSLTACRMTSTDLRCVPT